MSFCSYRIRGDKTNFGEFMSYLEYHAGPLWTFLDTVIPPAVLIFPAPVSRVLHPVSRTSQSTLNDLTLT